MRLRHFRRHFGRQFERRPSPPRRRGSGYRFFIRLAVLVVFLVIVFTSEIAGTVLTVLLILIFLFGGFSVFGRYSRKRKRESTDQSGPTGSSSDRWSTSDRRSSSDRSDQWSSSDRWSSSGRRSSAADGSQKLRSAAAVLMRVARVEGPGSPEWSATREQLLVLAEPRITRAQADDLMREAAHTDIEPWVFDEEERLVLLRLAVEIAAADGAVGSRERVVLEDIARKLELSASDVDTFIRLVGGTRAGGHRDPELEAACRTLGVRPDASMKEIRTAYRNLVKKHHPDRAPPRRRAEATRRTAEINAAYDLLIGRAENSR